MKTLTNEQIKIASGGSHGMYHEDGKAYQLDCPLVSQYCLDKFLICVESETMNDNELYFCIKSVVVDCDGAEGLMNISDCFDAHIK